MTAAAPILETRDLTFGFGGNLVTDHISLHVREGELISIIGPNGAGKTTFFNLVSGMYRPTTGTIYFRGDNVTRSSPEARARRGMARSFQLSNLFPSLTVLENVRLAAQARGRDSFHLLRPFTAYRHYIARAESALEMVGLTDRHLLPAQSLSHGDKRKLELAIVLAMEPDILLLDEPTSGLSAEDVPGMVDLIRKIRDIEKRTVLMVEHKIGVVLQLSERIAVLHQGKLLAFDTPARIQENESVQSAYLGKETV